jgi:Carboxypeptidase regulatory-like domain
MTSLSLFKRLVGAAVVLLLGVFICLHANAQFETASVLGFVHDSSGAAVPNAKVTLVNIASGVETTVTADAQGQFTFTSVRIGEYKVRGSAIGFSETITEPFTVTVNARQRVDVTLKPGAATETIGVTGAAALLNTEDSERGQIISARDVNNLPLNGRAYADLALLTPGVRANNLKNQSVTSRDASYNVNGQRS